MKKWNSYIRIVLLIVIAWTVRSCANRGQGPQGGPKDTTPPKVVKETPLNGALNYRSKQIEVEFDELVLAEKTMDNVIISPPQVKLPDIKARGKKIIVTFNEELKDSTTYTIQFGNAIVDNNEKNPLRNYFFAFSTGDVIDSLQVGGYVLQAENLNPVLGTLVGIHPYGKDSLFTSQPFMRIAQTDSAGHFSVQNMRGGNYAFYALSDNSRDYIFQAGEGIAFMDSMVIPSVHNEWHTDTLWVDSVTIDTIKQVYTPIYKPDSLILYHFKESKQLRQFTKYERKEQHFFRMYFSAPSDSTPKIRPLTYDWTSAMMMQTNPTNDTITCWLTDSLVIAMDSLDFLLSYQKSDSLYNLYEQTDTMKVVYRQARGNKNQSQVSDQEEFLNLKHNASNTFEVYDDLKIYAGTPIRHLNDSMLHFFLMKDTVKVPLDLHLSPADCSHMTFLAKYNWVPSTQYQLEIDSAAWIDIYGKNNTSTTLKWKIRPLEDYANMLIKITPFDSLAVIQLLSPKDEVVRQLPAKEEGVVFQNIRPGDYYMRLFIDTDQNGKWTSGNYDTRTQPEKVIYSPKKMTLRANWDFEELWDTEATPVLQQKPKELQQAAAKRK